MAGKNRIKPAAVIVAALAVTAAALSAVLLISINKGNKLKENAQESNDGTAQYTENAGSTADVTIVRTSGACDDTDYENRTIDFKALKEVNPDVCAWISVPGTGIDCAVVTDNDDPEYYLTNPVAGLKGVFMQSYNSEDFNDRMSVIYGRKDENGISPFENLFKFQDAEFYKENKYIYVYTPDGMKKYRIFAAHKALATHLMLGYDWDVDRIFLDYLIEVLNSRDMGDNIDKDTEITVEQKVITLSERVSGDDEKRFLVQGVLIE